MRTAGCLVVPTGIAMRQGPLLCLAGFEHRLSERWSRKAVGALMSPNPDQVSVPLDKNIFRRSAPPGFIFIEIAIARRHKPRHFLRKGGIADVKNADASVEPRHRNEIRLRRTGLNQALCVVRGKAATRKTEVRVRSIRRRLRAREETNNFRIARVLHVNDIRGVVDLPAIRLERFVRANQKILQPWMHGIGDHRQYCAERYRSERVEFILHGTVRLGMFEVGQIHAIHAEGPEPSVANRTPVLASLPYPKPAVVSRPANLVSSKNIFLVFFFLTESLTGHPPPRNFLDIRRVRQI